MDAAKFERIAVEFSRNQGIFIVSDFFIPDSLLISRIIAFFYSIFGESKMMAKCISLGLGVGSVYLVYKLSLILWDHSSAKKAAWITAIFPTLVLYSSITLRESYIVFFLLIGLIGIVKFMKENSLISYLQIVASFFILIFFHGPVAVGGFLFLLYLILQLSKKQLINIYHNKINLIAFFFIILSLIPLILLFTGSIKIPYLGSVKSLFFLDQYIVRINNYMYDTATYPSWLKINNSYEFFTKGVIKIFYFLYSPFIWDIKIPFHLVGLFDGTLYIMLTIYVIKNLNAIKENPLALVIIYLFIVYTIIYGLAIGNFGTGIRHRSKFVVILIVLAAPKLHKFILLGKEKLYKRRR